MVDCLLPFKLEWGVFFWNGRQRVYFCKTFFVRWRFVFPGFRRFGKNAQGQFRSRIYGNLD